MSKKNDAGAVVFTILFAIVLIAGAGYALGHFLFPALGYDPSEVLETAKPILPFIGAAALLILAGALAFAKKEVPADDTKEEIKKNLVELNAQVAQLSAVIAALKEQAQAVEIINKEPIKVSVDGQPAAQQASPVVVVQQPAQPQTVVIEAPKAAEPEIAPAVVIEAEPAAQPEIEAVVEINDTTTEEVVEKVARNRISASYVKSVATNSAKGCDAAIKRNAAIDKELAKLEAQLASKKTKSSDTPEVKEQLKAERKQIKEAMDKLDSEKLLNSQKAIALEKASDGYADIYFIIKEERLTLRKTERINNYEPLSFAEKKEIVAMLVKNKKAGAKN